MRSTCWPATAAASATCSRTASPTWGTSWTRCGASGGAALAPEVVTQLLVRSGRQDPLERLSPREREVLELMAEGRTNGSIAAQLVVTEGAVEKHGTSIFAK